MDTIEKDKIISHLVNKIIEIPGVLGFVSTSSTSNNPNLLSEAKYTDAIDLLETSKGIMINIHFIASANAPLDQISGQITKAIYPYLKEKKINSD